MMIDHMLYEHLLETPLSFLSHFETYVIGF